MNRKEYLFVDGYNVINDWNNLKALSDMQLELARNELIETMAEYRVIAGVEVIIVFDAYRVKSNPGREDNIKGVKVVFTKEHQTADAYIEQTLHRIGKVKRVRVATSDSLEQQVILGRGGTRISARELKIEIDDCRNRTIKKADIKSTSENVNMGKLGEELSDEVLQKLESYIDQIEEEKNRENTSKNKINSALSGGKSGVKTGTGRNTVKNEKNKKKKRKLTRKRKRK